MGSTLPDIVDSMSLSDFPDEILANIIERSQSQSIGCTSKHMNALANEFVHPTTLQLVRSIQQDRVEAVKKLLHDDRVTFKMRNVGLIKAIEANNINMVKLLLADRKADPSKYNYKAIRAAAKSGNTDILNLLLNDPRMAGFSNFDLLLIPAVKSNRKNLIVALLADPRVDSTANKFAPLKLNVQYGSDLETFQLLLNNAISRSQLNPRGREVVYDELFQLAAQYNRADILSFLLDSSRRYSDVYQRALNIAAQNGNVDAIQVLLADSRSRYPQIDLNAVLQVAVNSQAKGHDMIAQLIRSHSRMS